jgi:osmotically-inducible protein OsmY
MILSKIIKSSNYTLETINKKIYIFGISMDSNERNEVIKEANKIYDVEKIIPTIYLVSELSRNKS